MPSRRRYLASIAGSIAAVAGCAGLDSSNEDRTPRDQNDSQNSDGVNTTAEDGGANDADREDSDRTASSDTAIGVLDTAVRKAVKSYAWPGSTQIFAPRSQQFVVARMEASQEVDRANIEFVAGDRRWDPGEPVDGSGDAQTVAGLEGADYATTQVPFLVVFRVPSPLSASTFGIEFDGNTIWTPTDVQIDRLTSPEPEFELVAFELPESVDNGEAATITVEARNVSETDGRFLAEVHWPTLTHDDDEATVFEADVAAGESVSLEQSVDGYSMGCDRTPGEEMRRTVSLDGHVDAEETVTVRQTESFHEEYCDRATAARSGPLGR